MKLKAIKTGFVAGLLVAALAGCAEVGSVNSRIQLANDDARRGNTQAALAILRPLAEQGNVEAQYALAKIQLTPRWKDRDTADGEKWLFKAAEQEHVPAQFDLAYFSAVEEKNYPDALKWYRRVAEFHSESPLSIPAYENLGLIYENGLGVRQDYAEAVRWYQKSADRGGPQGQFALGLMRLGGLGGPKDFEAAVKWLGASARQGFYPASYTLTLAYAEGFDTKPNAVEAAYWYMGKRYSDEGEAAYYVGRFYSRGFIVWQQELRVLSLLLKLRGISEEASKRYLNQIYTQRWGDEDKAVQWYRTGAEAGFVGAQVDLARIMWDQESRYWNCAEAVKWTRLAAEKADPTAMVNMGMFYVQGPRERVVNMIGMEMEQTEKDIRVKSLVNGSPAEASGVRPDDVIVDVGGKDAGKLGLSGIINAIRATKDKDITLHMQRGSENKLRTINVTPKEMHFKCPGTDNAELKRDPAEAVKWFEKAADRGDLTGLFFLAEAYRKGTGVPQDYKKALGLYERGSSRDDWEAAQAISNMYASGEAGEKNKELAEQWYRKALDLKHKAVR